MLTIVIVGASLAGTRAAESLRDEGFAGRVVMVGDEPGRPYDRPPLSKQFLSGTWTADQLDLLSEEDLDELKIERRLGTRAVSLDVGGHRVLLGDGTALAYDGLVVATGARPRAFPSVPPELPAVHLLRTLEDSARLAAAIRRPGCMIGVIGGGFLGCEVASVARELGVSVTVIEQAQAPMGDVLGEMVGACLEQIQRARGVEVLTGARVREISSAHVGSSARVEVGLGSGRRLAFDEVLVSIGAVPNVEWLSGSGLRIDGGLVCDAALFASDDIVAAGDVARIADGDGTPRRRVEHWTNAVQQGELAAANLLAGRKSAVPYSALPYVWSDQFGVRIEIVGEPAVGDRVTPVVAEPVRERYLFAYRREERIAGLVGVNASDFIVRVRKQVTDPGGWDDGLISGLSQGSH